VAQWRSGAMVPIITINNCLESLKPKKWRPTVVGRFRLFSRETVPRLHEIGFVFLGSK
jgi:hypothetical protein